jgi:uncharacterized membrane protein YfcA
MAPMADEPPRSGPQVARSYTPTALPSVTARWLAFLAILLGGACGGLIGYSVTDIQCGNDDDPGVAEAHERDPNEGEEGCTTWAAGGGLIGGVVGAGGTAIVSVLVLRAMSEWRRELDLEADE